MSALIMVMTGLKHLQQLYIDPQLRTKQQQNLNEM